MSIRIEASLRVELECTMVNGVALGEEEAFKVGLLVFFTEEGGDFSKAWVFAEIAIHFLEVVFVVGGDVHNAIGDEDTCKGVAHFALEKAIFVMATFGPWIGEEEIHGLYAMVGKEFADESAGFDTEEGEVVEGALLGFA